MATIRQVIDGLEILAKYGNGAAQHVMGEHDVIYGAEDVVRDTLTAEDAAAMKAAGWHWDDECESWSRFT
jgi:hypothetical protein